MAQSLCRQTLDDAISHFLAYLRKREEMTLWHAVWNWFLPFRDDVVLHRFEAGVVIGVVMGVIGSLKSSDSISAAEGKK